MGFLGFTCLFQKVFFSSCKGDAVGLQSMQDTLLSYEAWVKICEAQMDAISML